MVGQARPAFTRRRLARRAPWDPPRPRATGLFPAASRCLAGATEVARDRASRSARLRVCARADRSSAATARSPSPRPRGARAQVHRLQRHEYLPGSAKAQHRARALCAIKATNSADIWSCIGDSTTSRLPPGSSMSKPCPPTGSRPPPSPSTNASNKRTGPVLTTTSSKPTGELGVVFASLSRCWRRFSTQPAKVAYLIPARRANFAPLARSIQTHRATPPAVAPARAPVHAILLQNFCLHDRRCHRQPCSDISDRRR